jgi:hypothetical protein
LGVESIDDWKQFQKRFHEAHPAWPAS